MIPSTHQHWLINTRSGNGAGERLLKALQGLHGVSAQAINFNDLAEQVKGIPRTDLIVIAGGDGTFSAVLGLSEVRDRHAACVPLGTANDLARELSVSRHLRGHRYEEYPSLLARLPFRNCSVWSLFAEGREFSFINYISIGYEGAVVRDFAAWRSLSRFQGRLANRVAYTIFGLRNGLGRISGLTVHADSGASISCHKTTGIIITNIKSHLGMATSNNESDPSDELIEVISVPTLFGFVRMLIAGLGLLAAPSPLLRGRRVTIGEIPAGTPIQIDGETKPAVQRGNIEVNLKHFVRIATA